MLQKSYKGHESTISSILLLPNNRFASGSFDSTIKIWDIASGKLLKTLRGHLDCVWSLVYVPSINQIVSGSWDRTILFWSLDFLDKVAGKKEVRKFGVKGSWRSLSNKGSQKKEEDEDEEEEEEDEDEEESEGESSSDEDEDSDRGRVDTDLIVGRIDDHSNQVYCLLLLNENQIMTSSRDLSIKVFDVSTKKCLKTLRGNKDTVFFLLRYKKSLVISVSGKSDTNIKIWDFKKGKCVQNIPTNHTESVQVAALIKGKSMLVTGSYDSTIKIWDLQSGNLLKIFRNHTKQIFDLQFLQNGRLISASQDNKIKIFDLESNMCIRTYDLHTNWVRIIRRLENGQILSAGDDKVIKRWIPLTEREVKDKNERFAFLFNKINLFDFKIVLKNQTLHCFKSLLITSKLLKIVPTGEQDDMLFFSTEEEESEEDDDESDAEEENDGKEYVDYVRIDESLDIDNETFLKALFGLYVVIDPIYLIDYFILFRELRLIDESYIICKKVEFFTESRIAFRIFEEALDRLEGIKVNTDIGSSSSGSGSSDSGSGSETKPKKEVRVVMTKKKRFKSPFTLSVFNAIKTYFGGKKKVPTWEKKFLNSIGLWGVFMQPVIHFRKHNFFRVYFSDISLQRKANKEKKKYIQKMNTVRFNERLTEGASGVTNTNQSNATLSPINPRVTKGVGLSRVCSYSSPSKNMFGFDKKKGIPKSTSTTIFLKEGKLDNYDDDDEELSEQDFGFHLPYSFYDIFQKKLKTLNSLGDRKKLYNLILLSDRKMFYVHAEILILFSNYFYKMISFPGEERYSVRNKKIVTIQYVSTLELKKIVNYLYTGKINVQLTETVILFRLINFASKYFEVELKECLIEMLKDFSRNYFAHGVLARTLLKYGYIIEEKEIISKLIRFLCKLKIIRKKAIITSLVDASEYFRDAKAFLGEKTEELKYFDKKIYSLNARVSHKEAVIHTMKKKIAESNKRIKAMIEAISKLEKRSKKEKEKSTKEVDSFT